MPEIVTVRRAKNPGLTRVYQLVAVVNDRVSAFTAMVAICLLTAPQWMPHGFRGPVELIAIYSILGVGLAILLGYTGQFVVSQGAVYAIGAYTCGLLNVRAGWSVWVCFPAAAVLAGVLGSVLGLPALRLRGQFLAVATLGFAIVTPELLLEWKGLTGGYNGLSGVHRPSVGSHILTSDEYYYVVAVICIAVLWTMHNLLRSRWRLAFLSVNDDESAAQVLGISVFRVKFVAFFIMSFLGGLAGALYASYLRFLSPDIFGIDTTILFFTIVAVGGPISLVGPCLGSAVFVLLPQMLSGVRDYNVLIWGTLLIIFQVFVPDGLVGGLNRLRVAIGSRLARIIHERREGGT